MNGAIGTYESRGGHFPILKSGARACSEVCKAAASQSEGLEQA